MKHFFASILGALGIGAAGMGTQACWAFFFDEAECPESLIK